MVFNDVVIITNVKFDGDRFNTAYDFAVTLDNYLQKNQLYRQFCDLSTIDIPVSTNKFALDCICFMRMVEPRYHSELADRINGLIIFREVKINVRLGRHHPKPIASFYWDHDLAWKNPYLLTKEPVTV